MLLLSMFSLNRGAGIFFSLSKALMRVNRSIQAEGAFGAIKQNMAYTRLSRSSLPKAIWK